ncbi:uncharacterized protein UV8b_01440 [Ustilaginoidea virens]|uniref:Uncharacterized protein n=2 Tax=Ustilaginoidea virens TaxID=1159556 RepID=A0A8E5HKR5_USTVR|nr:uncharacterized protein UV8b_01440 [Ustilaginoidea virens]QUC17199.1 hypothetical protein UV8b_01440 [Ustilaginoidea virens]
MLKAYKNLSPRARAGLGAGIIAWSLAGTYLSDRAEETFGFAPSDQDREALWKWAPKITAVEKPKPSPDGRPRPFASHLQPSKGLAWIGIKQQLLVTPSAQLGAWLFFMSSIITRKAESLNIVQFHGCRA